MELDVREAPSRAGRSARNPKRGNGTVREVCLVGGHPETLAWRSGGQVEWGGRPYQVASLQHSSTTHRDSSRRYVHLVPLS